MLVVGAHRILRSQELKELLPVRPRNCRRGSVTQLRNRVIDAGPLDHLVRKRQAQRDRYARTEELSVVRRGVD